MCYRMRNGYAVDIQHKVTCCHMKDVYARKSKEIERKNDFDLLLTTMEELDLFEYKLNMVFIVKYVLWFKIHFDFARDRVLHRTFISNTKPKSTSHTPDPSPS